MYEGPTYLVFLTNLFDKYIMQSVEIESISKNVLYFLSFSFVCDNKFDNIQFSLGQLQLGYLHAGLWINHFT